MRLNINQLIALLAIARGTFSNELKLGTTSADMRVLGREGLVVRQVADSRGETYALTSQGSELVQALKCTADEYLKGTNGISVGQLAVQVDTTALRPILNELRDIAHAVHGNGFEPEPDTGNGLQLSDAEDGKARVNGGTFFVVAQADVTVEEKGEDILSISLAKVDPLVHATEAQATDVAIDRAKTQVGSRHVVLKAVAMHEIAVPIKSTRL